MHYNATVIAAVIPVTAMNANSAVSPDATGSIDTARADDSVGVFRDESTEKACGQQSRNEKLH
jgi:hypothetical protein